VKGSASRARSFLYYHEDGQRLWWVGSFPYSHVSGTPLRDVEITTKDENGRISSQLSAPLARWNASTREWQFQHAELMTVPTDEDTIPVIRKLESPHIIKGWSETPWLIVRPGLSAQYLGIPELRSWLNENRESAWEERRPFLTQHHYRWAQPWMCLVVVLLATPLGIVFTRRGMAGGVSVALILGACMLLSAEVFLSLGSAGYLGPAAAAWGTNVVFAILGVFLIYRRLQGRPIYQSIKNLIPSN
jgi:lipopolysaccharide export LptBFGC system permease protein LptF